MSVEMPRVTINMSEEENQELEKLAKSEKRSKSKQLLYMMQFYIDNYKKP